ncbi:MAG: YdcH family protein [Pseudomonadota bacterium]
MTEVRNVQELKKKHADLEIKIEKENQRPLPDNTYIHKLKREKLRIKDKLLKLATG